jgi:peroxiredoxin
MAGKVILLTGDGAVQVRFQVCRTAGALGARGLQVIGVSVDDTMDKLAPFARQFRINYPILQGLGHDEVQEAYGPIWGIPINIVISRDGKICAKHTGLPPSEGGPIEKAVKEAYEAEIKALL